MKQQLASMHTIRYHFYLEKVQYED